MKNAFPSISRPGRFWAVVLILSGLVPVVFAQQQFRGLCNRVKIEIAQELTTERIGFEAVLKVTNNDGEDPITNFSAALTFTDKETGEDASERFFVQPPDLSSINRIDGTGNISPTQTAIVTWFIIPKTGENAPGGEDPRGKLYDIGCNLAGSIRGEPIPGDVLFAVSDTITVRPEPQLAITYFQPRDVQGDDPFTPEVESPVPFTLGVMVKNDGFGIAKKVRIDSQQPKIQENRNGLLLIARLLGARVQDSPLDETSLLVDLGDIEPAKVKKGAWDMITSLSGEFVEFQARYTHADDLGGEATSLIKSLDAHFIAREVLNDEPGRDAIMDFLADTDRDSNRIPDTLYETDGAILPVNYQPQATIGSLSGGKTTVTLNADREGWVYLRLDDPAQFRFPIASVVRNDGKVLNPRNYWTNVRYRPSDNFRLTYLNLFDRVENGVSHTYDVTYQTTNNDATAPETRIRFSGEVSGDGPYFITPETQIYFTSEDDSPVSIEYQLDGGGFRPAIPFDLDLPGTYVVEFFASDVPGNVEATKSATLIIPEAGAPIDLIADENRIFPSDLLSIRPNQTPIRANVPPSSVEVNGRLRIYRGVVAFPQLAGIPMDPTPQSGATIGVSGQFVEFYQYRINGGAWSAERPVDQLIELIGLSGPVNLEVRARHGLGDYLEDSQALAATWTVDPSAEDLTITGLPPTPTREGSIITANVATNGTSTQYRWSPGGLGFYRPAEPYTTPITRERLPEGDYQLTIITNQGGVFPDEADPDPVGVARWTYDRSWGFDFSSLTEIRSEGLGNVAGTGISFVWDGRDSEGVEQIPGAYTVSLELTDALGNITRAASLVEIEGLSSSRISLATPSVAPGNLRARGDWAVWQQRVGTTLNIFGDNLSDADPPTAITTSVDLDQEDPTTDGGYVVWQTRLPNGSTDLRYSSLEAPAPAIVTETPGKVEANPVIEWPWVVYQVKDADSPSAPWQVEAWNAQSNERFLVFPGVGDQFRPQIHGGRIVWEDHRDVGPGEVYFADLETREVLRITNNTFGQNNPTIHGDRIAWQDNRSGQVDIYLRDLRRPVEEQITSTTYNEANPLLSGNWLLFTEDSLGPQLDNLVIHDLQAGSQLSLTRATRRHTLGGLGNGFGVWIETVNGARTVVASRLPGLQAVMTSTNALAVSPGLVSRFDSAFDLLQGWGGSNGVTSVSLYQSLDPVSVVTAEYNGGSPSGDDFALVPGSFLWVQFEAANLVDLGSGGFGEVTVESGVNVLSYTGFPVGFTAYDLVGSIGATKVRGIRLYDAFSAVWRSVEIDPAGLPTGPNFTIPRVATLIMDLREAATFTPKF